jgi:acetyltransferase-like isoleucine patch superfamily enzyme
MIAFFKKNILYILITTLVFFIKLIHPFNYFWRRVYCTASLNAKIKNSDISVICDGKIHVTGTKNISIGKRCRLGADTELRTVENGNIRLADDIRINRGCTITSYSNVSIGNFTIIGEYSSIRDANHGMSKNTPMRFQAHSSSPIRIGCDVWIGRGSCILPGVSIGDGSVIGANSVVTKDIPPGVIAAGAPAVIIRER